MPSTLRRLVVRFSLWRTAWPSCRFLPGHPVKRVHRALPAPV
nr:MAG TPA: hypothetical protein [Caudoviricetes sp.]DAR17369.1 MAG TPA: hypothetical protein [Caudoviricetes sp.]